MFVPPPLRLSLPRSLVPYDATQTTTYTANAANQTIRNKTKSNKPEIAIPNFAGG
jgi:hypothetical protein